MNEYTICVEFMQDCFSDLWTLYLTLIGILLSILTLLYSFIISKKDELKLIAEQIKLGGATPLINQRKSFAISYIRRLANINKKCFVKFFLLCGRLFFMIGRLSLLGSVN